MSAPGARGRALFCAFSAAVFAAIYLLPQAAWPWLGVGALTLAGPFLWAKRRAAALVCLGAAAGLLWCGAYRAVFFAPAQALDGRQTTVTFYLSERAEENSYGAGATGWVAQPGYAPVQATLYGDGALLDLGPGDKVTALANCAQTALRPESRFTARATRGIFLRLMAVGPVEVERADGVPWWCLPRWWGDRLGRSIQKAVGGDVSGLLRAMVTGDRTGMANSDQTALKRAGVSHLIAVSGLHVSFLVSLITFFTGYDPRRRAFLGIPVILFFTLAVGGSPSVARACCFQLALLIAQLLGREAEQWTTLWGTLALLLLLDPFSAANVSLQLSFAAVAGMALMTPRVYVALSRFRVAETVRGSRAVNGALRFVSRLLATTVGATLFTLPLCAWYFQSVSLATPLTNLLALPVAGLLFAGGLLVGLVGLVLPGPAAALGWVLSWPARYTLWVARRISALPYSSLPLNQFNYAVALAAAYALLLAAVLPPRRRRWVLVSCAAGLVVGSILLTRWEADTAAATVAVLDVGQGQSVAFVSGGQTALVDCGGDSFTDPGDVCADYLNALGRTRLDTLILTHYDDDHVNGLPALFDRLEVGELVLPAMDRDEDRQAEILALAVDEGAAVTWIEEDQTLPLGNLTVELYAPLGDGTENEEGLSALARTGGFAMLMTGDMTTQVEEKLAAHAHLPRCQVFVAGHHGSRYASGDVLLDAIQPENVIISVGAYNNYGHPSPEILERLTRRGARIYRTDRQGTITLRVPS